MGIAISPMLALTGALGRQSLHNSTRARCAKTWGLLPRLGAGIILMGAFLAHGTDCAASSSVDSILGPPFKLRNRPWIGDKDAPVVVIEISAFTCGHCQAFHRRLFPALKKRYIETGMLRWTMIPTLIAPPDLSPMAGVAMAPVSIDAKDPNAQLLAVAHLAINRERYWEIESLLFESEKISRNELYISLAKGIGVDVSTLEKATGPESAIYREVSDDITEAIQANVRHTPTFLIRRRMPTGKYLEMRIEGYQSQDYFDHALSSIIQAP